MLKLFFRAVRPVLGALILWWERNFPPQTLLKRPADVQRRVDAELTSLALYEFLTCPFCVKVRRELKRLAIDIERRDARDDTEHRRALLIEGGKVQVPCLRISPQAAGAEPSWMYESEEIIAYLRQRFGSK